MGWCISMRGERGKREEPGVGGRGSGVGGAPGAFSAALRKQAGVAIGEIRSSIGGSLNLMVPAPVVEPSGRHAAFSLVSDQRV